MGGKIGVQDGGIIGAGHWNHTGRPHPRERPVGAPCEITQAGRCSPAGFSPEGPMSGNSLSPGKLASLLPSETLELVNTWSLVLEILVGSWRNLK